MAVEMMGKTSDNKYPVIYVDKITKGLATIETDHSYIHDSLLFETFFNETVTASETRLFTITTPATSVGKTIHYRNEKIMTSADKVLIELYEDSTIDATGTSFTPINHNRVYIIDSTCVVQREPTLSADGDLIAQNYIGGGTNVGGNRSGDDTKQANEFMLKHATTYTVKITNNSGSSNVIQVNMTWYEEDTYE